MCVVIKSLDEEVVQLSECARNHQMQLFVDGITSESSFRVHDQLPRLNAIPATLLSRQAFGMNNNYRTTQRLKALAHKR